jgi:hypothetical protein
MDIMGLNVPGLFDWAGNASGLPGWQQAGQGPARTPRPPKDLGGGLVQGVWVGNRPQPSGCRSLSPPVTDTPQQQATDAPAAADCSEMQAACQQPATWVFQSHVRHKLLWKLAWALHHACKQVL